jgi:CBS domain-containing protein
VHRNTAFTDIAALFAVHRISTVPVLDDNRRVLGVVSETDLFSKGKDRAHDRNGVHSPALVHRRRLRGRGGAARAHELMSAPAITVDADAAVATAAQRLERDDVKHLPVVDHDGRLLGIVGRSDLLRVYLRPDRDIAAEINDEILGGSDDARAEVSDGVVVLRGQVRSTTVIADVATRVRNVAGVITVIEHLTNADKARFTSRDH